MNRLVLSLGGLDCVWRSLPRKSGEIMTNKLDWKWIGIGVVIMVALNILVGLILGLFSHLSCKEPPIQRTLI